MRAEAVAEYMDMSYAHVTKRVITQPDFPKPARLNGTGYPRWLRSEVAAWMRSQQ
jgi:predicted DNA-binding transcriptional regulator AlpA